MTDDRDDEYTESLEAAEREEATHERRSRKRSAAAERKARQVEEASWTSELTRNDQGKPHSDLANAVAALQSCPEWLDVLSWDAFRSCVISRYSPPWAGDYDDPDRVAIPGDRPYSDADVARTAVWLARNAGVRVSPGVAFDAVQLVARTASHHPVQQWLTGLQWDGVRRLDGWLAAYAGVADNAYTTAVGRWWMISAVARVMQPGCKADHVLILEGTQGAGKSTLASILARRWYTDTPIELGSKDSYLALRGRWIVELAELDSLSRADASRAKAFLSSARDVYRPPYGREPVEVARQCVFIGTVNHAEYLRDETGARRYWPVKVGRIDLEALRRDVDQLWAETYAAWKAGVQWYPRTEEERALCSAEQQERYVGDVWDERVAEFVSRKRARLDYDGWISIPEVLEECLDVPPAQQDVRAQMRVGKIMLSLGWTHARKPARLDRLRRRAYRDPERGAGND